MMEHKIAFLLQGNKMDQDSSGWKRCNVEDDTTDVSRITSGMKKLKSIHCFSVVPTCHNERSEVTSREERADSSHSV